MQNRLPTPAPAPLPTPNEWDSTKPIGQNLRDHYQYHQAMFRARVERGESPEAVRESTLACVDLIAAVGEDAIEDAFNGVSAPDQVVEAAMAEFPVLPQPGDN